MSTLHQHDDLDPYFFDFVPEGRGKIDKGMYQLMRWFARKHRKAIYQRSLSLMQGMMMYGHGYAKIEWNAE